MVGIGPSDRKKGGAMKCEECRKKIVFDHYLGTTGSNSNGGAIRLVFKCDCGFYMVPFEFVEISRGRGLIFSGKMKRCKTDEGIPDGKRLSQEGLKIYHQQGEQAYDRWTKEVFLPLMDAKLKKLRTCAAR